jgi:radical SAM protein with 4Fe4S-binding SPASM domain
MDPKNTIKNNIKRRTSIVNENIGFYKDVPLPKWIELSLIDVCNRTCSFCPKSDPSIAPDTYQKMSRVLIDKLVSELKLIGYDGSIVLCGYGEPLLHKDIFYITNQLAQVSSVEIVTNGDVLTSDLLNKLYKSNVSKVLISMYDGPEQITSFNEIIRSSGVPKSFAVLRDRWYDDEKDFGVKLTNRTGTISIGNQVSNDTYTTCYYPSYQLLIDWNGDVFICPQDWQRRNTMGNMMQENIFNIWVGKIFTKYRKNLLNGKRKLNPCNSCNANGTLLGINHANIWREIYAKKLI